MNGDASREEMQSFEKAAGFAGKIADNAINSAVEKSGIADKTSEKLKERIAEKIRTKNKKRMTLKTALVKTRTGTIKQQEKSET